MSTKRQELQVISRKRFEIDTIKEKTFSIYVKNGEHDFFKLC
jgi:hypothetical protein